MYYLILVKEVSSKNKLYDFVRFSFKLNKKHPFWVGPIIGE